jgi:hypothetical protein
MSEDNPTSRKWTDLTARIIFATDTNRLNWSSGAFDHEVVTSIGNVVVTLAIVDEERSDFSITITDETGDFVDSFRDIDLIGTINSLPPHKALANLFRAAKRSISGADMILDKMLAALPPHPDEIPF